MFGRLGDYIDDLLDWAETRRMVWDTRKFVAEQERETEAIHARKMEEFVKCQENGERKREFVGAESLEEKLHAIVKKYYPDYEEGEGIGRKFMDKNDIGKNL